MTTWKTSHEDCSQFINNVKIKELSQRGKKGEKKNI